MLGFSVLMPDRWIRLGVAAVTAWYGGVEKHQVARATYPVVRIPISTDCQFREQLPPSMLSFFNSSHNNLKPPIFSMNGYMLFFSHSSHNNLKLGQYCLGLAVASAPALASCSSTIPSKLNTIPPSWKPFHSFRFRLTTMPECTRFIFMRQCVCAILENFTLILKHVLPVLSVPSRQSLYWWHQVWGGSKHFLQKYTPTQCIHWYVHVIFRV